jgi:hypothetical protein
MIDAVDQHADADDVGRQDEFLPLVVRHFSRARQPFDRRHPFLLGRLDIADEGMQMLDHRLHDLAESWIGHRLPAIEHDVGDITFGNVGHDVLHALPCRTIRG